jgi:multidrug efflux pump subunit AcrA (membrane-fusion protein)
VVRPSRSDDAERVTFIDPAIDSRTGMGSVDAALTNPGFVVGQFLGARIVLQERNCLAAPAESIVRDSLGRAQIALVEPDGRSVEMRIVNTGIRDGDMIEIEGPDLQAGAKIVTTGAYGLVTRAGIAVENP